MAHRNRLMVLLLAATLPLAALALVFLRTGFEAEKERAGRDELGVAVAGAVAAESFMQGNLNALTAVAPNFHEADALPFDELSTRLQSVAEAHPYWTGLGLFRPDGSGVVGSNAGPGEISIADRAYFQEFQRTGEGGVSDGVISRAIAQPVVAVYTPVVLSGGERGLLVAGLQLDALGTALRRLLPPGHTLEVIDAQGQLIVSPGDSTTLVPAGDRPEVAAAAAGGRDVIEAERRGEQQLVAYAPVTEFGWSVVTSEPTSEAYGAAWDFVLQGLAIMGIAFGGILGLGWYAGGRLSQSYQSIALARSQAERALARAGAAELHRMQLLEAEQEARQRAEEALRSRDEFLSIASHELRNPVAGIKGIAQLIQRRIERGTLSPDDLEEYIDNIAGSSTYLARLVEDLLNVSRLQGGQFALRMEETDLVDAVRRSVREVANGGRLVEITAPPEPFMLEMDVDRIQQILLNLLENAAKYSPDTEPIQVAVEQRPGGVVVSVTDHGIGLPPGAVEGLFAPFGRAPNAQAANIPGLGLGLYISRRLAEAHGGTLEAASPGEGRGSTFTLTLPPAVGTGEGGAPPAEATLSPVKVNGTPIPEQRRQLGGGATDPAPGEASQTKGSLA